jgi:ferredoxin-NADP reductase
MFAVDLKFGTSVLQQVNRVELLAASKREYYLAGPRKFASAPTSAGVSHQPERLQAENSQFHRQRTTSLNTIPCGHLYG